MPTKYYRGIALDELERERVCCRRLHRSWQGAIACVKLIAFSWETRLAMEVTKEGRAVCVKGWPVYKSDDA